MTILCHYDLRFGNPDEDTCFGYTLQGIFPHDGIRKVNSTEKINFTTKFMNSNSRVPGLHNSRLKILDKGYFELVRKTENFCEFVLKKCKNTGRYFASTVNIRAASLTKYSYDDKPLTGKLCLIYRANIQDKTSFDVYGEIGPKVEYRNYGEQRFVEILD